MEPPNTTHKPSLRGPWLEYTLAAIVYAALAYWLYSIRRPGLFWLCIVFGVLSIVGALYLYRRPRDS